MIISRTPFRVSFLGGGSDIPWYYENSKEGGCVLSTSIRRYMNIAIHAFFGDKRIRLKYAKLEDVERVDDIQHPIIRAALSRVDVGPGTEITSFADIPTGTGLGSSSSFTVGLLNALHRMAGRSLPKWELAEQACEIELNDVGSPIGKQDQFAAAFGGMNVFRFMSDGRVLVEPLRVGDETIKRMQANLRLYYVGGCRDANRLLKEQGAPTAAKIPWRRRAKWPARLRP